METTEYKVVPGNTLWGIANFFGTTVDEIAKLNGISDTDLIYPEQVLKIPVAKPQPPKYYVVRPSDTLYEIAKRYGLTVNEIIELNKISYPNLIYPGQILMLRK